MRTTLTIQHPPKELCEAHEVTEVDVLEMGRFRRVAIDISDSFHGRYSRRTTLSARHTSNC
jgi:hypothetical protein